MNRFSYDNIEKYKYRLTSSFTFDLPSRRPVVKNGLFVPERWIGLSIGGAEMHFEEGYCWDGSSGPTIDSQKCQKAGLIHDGGYQMLREGVYGSHEDKENARQYFDDLYRQMCIDDGMGSFRAWTRWKGLRWFGKRAASVH